SDAYDYLSKNRDHVMTGGYFNCRTLVVVDECQDLNGIYIHSLANMVIHLGVNVWLIGDKLQNVYNIEDNVFSDDFASKFQSRYNNCLTYESNENICRRFENNSLKNLTNALVPFDYFQVNNISGINPKFNASQTNDDNFGNPYVQIKCFGHNKYDNGKTKCNNSNCFDNSLQDLIDSTKKIIMDNVYVPSDVLVMFPIINNNILVEDVYDNFGTMWVEILSDQEYKI